MKTGTTLTDAMSRRAEAVIHTDALRHNLAQVRKNAPQAQIYAAIKADAYGHGAAQVAEVLQAADGFALASLDEALRLRWSGVQNKPLMLLSTPITPEKLALCAEHQLQPVVFEQAHLAALAEYSGPPIEVWIKLDTGMHRLGLEPALAQDIYALIQNLTAVSCVGWLTHLACADDVNDPNTPKQIQVFTHALGDLPGKRSIANSAGIVAWPDCHLDMVRPGIMLYGGSPLLDKTAEELDLRPAMTLSAPLISIKDVAAGEAVGYGATWRAPKTTRIGIVAIGYGDGYPRHVPSGTPVLVNGKRSALIGRVSMDMITVDLGTCPQAKVGDIAVLWGQGLPADEIAQAAGTIAYELFCQLTPRVSFRYEK